MTRECCMAAMLSLAAVCAVAQDRSSALPIATAAGSLRVSAGAPTTEITLRFDGSIPEALDVIRMGRNVGEAAWRLAEVSRAVVSSGRIVLRGPAGLETLLLLRAWDRSGYMVDGPFRWPHQPATYVVGARWRRTVRGRAPHAGGPLSWVSAAEQTAPDSWPVCGWIAGAEWECVGVSISTAGVVVGGGAGEIWFAIAPGVANTTGIETVVARTSGWGRLVTITPPARGTGAGRNQVEVAVRRLQQPRTRPRSVRLEVVADPRVRVERVASRAFWVGGAEAPEDAWIEIWGESAATERLDVRDVSGGPAEMPLRVRLGPAAAIAGRVTAGVGLAASGAVVTLSRFVGEPPDDPKLPQKRVTIAEVRADAEGAFRFEDLATERYELIAMHPVYGRGESRVEARGPEPEEVEVPLRRAPQAVGRVLRDGVPASGVRVTVAPDLAQFAAAKDMTELRGGETVTDQDGRFSVSLAARGSGELRIGDESGGVRRVPLGPADASPPVVDVGTIDINTLLPVTLVLEGSDGCELLMTGPIGRTGMTIARSTRLGPAMFRAALPEPGRWHIVAVCNRRERAVLPGVIDVSAARRDVTIRLTWPE